MNINKGSWHYRLLESWDSNGSHSVPDNLCPYVRRLLFCLSLLFFMVTVLVFTAASILAFLFAVFMTDWLGESNFFQFMAVTGFMVVTTTVVIAAWHGAVAVTQRIKHRAHDTRLVKQDNIVTSYIRAKHDKICTKINFKD